MMRRWGECTLALTDENLNATRRESNSKSIISMSNNDIFSFNWSSFLRLKLALDYGLLDVPASLFNGT
jgi:hypothetical protein